MHLVCVERVPKASRILSSDKCAFCLVGTVRKMESAKPWQEGSNPDIKYWALNVSTRAYIDQNPILDHKAAASIKQQLPLAKSGLLCFMFCCSVVVFFFK